MTEPDNHCCAACGRPAPVKLMTQQTAYHVSFLAPAGIYRDVIIAETPREALERARKRVETGDLPAESFDPVAESYCVRRIIVEHPDGEEQAEWTDPDNIAQLHADEILELLEDMIEAADQLSEQRDAFENSVYEMVSAGEQAALSLKTIRREGGVQ